MRYAPLFCALTMAGLSACGGDGQPSEDAAETGPASVTVAERNGPLGAVPIPDENSMSESKVALGHQLFFDSRLSVDGSRSCYSCHRNENGNGSSFFLSSATTGGRVIR